MIIKRVSDIDDQIGEFINKEFAEYGVQSGVELNFEEFHFVAEDEDGKVIGVITGRAYYNEVYIGDLIIDKNIRRNGLGRQLVEAVEKSHEYAESVIEAIYSQSRKDKQKCHTLFFGIVFLFVKQLLTIRNHFTYLVREGPEWSLSGVINVTLSRHHVLPFSWQLLQASYPVRTEPEWYPCGVQSDQRGVPDRSNSG